MITKFKKILLAFLILPLFQIKIPEVPKIENKIPETSFATYSDSEMTKEVSNFSLGQIVYVKADINSTLEGNTNLNLLNSNKKFILSIGNFRNGKIITANFKSPETSGIYYLHLEVKGENLSFIGERNINIGDIQGGDVRSESVIKNVINSSSVSGVQDNNELSETQPPFPNPSPKPEPVKNPILKFFSIFWDKLIVFLKLH